MPTVAVRAVLMTYDFAKPTRYQREACAVVGKVARMVASNLDWLRGAGRGHPKWQEVDLDARVVSWERSACARLASRRLRDYKVACSSVPDARGSRTGSVASFARFGSRCGRSFSLSRQRRRGPMRRQRS